MTDETKQCPYCAETIKSEAVVCRFCGHELATERSVKSEPIAKENKNKSGRKLILVLVGGLLLACCGIMALTSIFSDSSSTSPTANISNESNESDGNRALSNPTSKPQPTTPPIEEILETVADMTDAQRNNYNDNVTGSRIEGWEGEVFDVDEGEVFGGFTIYIDMIDSNLGAEVHIDVPEDVALSLNKGQKVVFSGDVKSVSDILGTTVFVENATVESAE